MNHLIGRAFGRLLVLERLGAYHRCQCACGASAVVRTDRLKSGKTKSCGCLGQEMRDALAAAKVDRIAAAKPSRRRKRTPVEKRLYAVWAAMVRRCTNPKDRGYPRYGGRGITVCQEWMDADTFIADMKPRYAPGLWLERKNNELGYSKANCTFATPRRQARNRANTLWLQAFENTKDTLHDRVSLADLARKYAVPYPRAYAWYGRVAAAGDLPSEYRFAEFFGMLPQEM